MKWISKIIGLTITIGIIILLVLVSALKSLVRRRKRKQQRQTKLKLRSGATKEDYDSLVAFNRFLKERKIYQAYRKYIPNLDCLLVSKPYTYIRHINWFNTKEGYMYWSTMDSLWCMELIKLELKR